MKFGFCDIPRPMYIFISKEGDSCWYTLSEDGKQEIIKHKAITGVIRFIEFNKPVETTYGVAYKTDIHYRAHVDCVIRSGRDSYFSKSLLFALDRLSPEQLKEPLILAPNGGDKTAVFCGLYLAQTQQRVEFSWDNHKNVNLDQLEARIAAKFATGVVAPTSPDTSTVNRQTLIDKLDQIKRQYEITDEETMIILKKNFDTTNLNSLTFEDLSNFSLIFHDFAENVATNPF